VLEAVLNAGVDVNNSSPYPLPGQWQSNQSALHVAAQHSQPDCVDMLLAKGADMKHLAIAVDCSWVEAKERPGWTALHYAVVDGNLWAGNPEKAAAAARIVMTLRCAGTTLDTVMKPAPPKPKYSYETAAPRILLLHYAAKGLNTRVLDAALVDMGGDVTRADLQLALTRASEASLVSKHGVGRPAMLRIRAEVVGSLVKALLCTGDRSADQIFYDGRENHDDDDDDADEFSRRCLSDWNVAGALYWAIGQAVREGSACPAVAKIISLGAFRSSLRTAVRVGQLVICRSIFQAHILECRSAYPKKQLTDQQCLAPLFAGAVLKTGEDIKYNDPEEWHDCARMPLLIAAVHAQQIDVVKLLLQNGADVATRTQYTHVTRTKSLKKDRYSYMRNYHDSDSDDTVDTKEVKSGFSALHLAAKLGNAGIVDALLEAGALIDDPGNMHRTDEIQNRRDLECGCSPEIVGECDIRPLELAVFGGHFQIAHNLVQRGAEIKKAATQRRKVELDMLEANVADSTLDDGPFMNIVEFAAHKGSELAMVFTNAVLAANAEDLREHEAILCIQRVCRAFLTRILQTKGSQQQHHKQQARRFTRKSVHFARAEKRARILAAQELRDEGKDLSYEFWVAKDCPGFPYLTDFPSESEQIEAASESDCFDSGSRNWGKIKNRLAERGFSVFEFESTKRKNGPSYEYMFSDRELVRKRQCYSLAPARAPDLDLKVVRFSAALGGQADILQRIRGSVENCYQEFEIATRHGNLQCVESLLGNLSITGEKLDKTVVENFVGRHHRHRPSPLLANRQREDDDQLHPSLRCLLRQIGLSSRLVINRIFLTVLKYSCTQCDDVAFVEKLKQVLHNHSCGCGGKHDAKCKNHEHDGWKPTPLGWLRKDCGIVTAEKAKQVLGHIETLKICGDEYKAALQLQVTEDWNSCNMRHSVPLVIAAAYGRCEICSLLLLNGADPLLCDSLSGMNAIHAAARRSDHHLLDALLQHAAASDAETLALALDGIDRIGCSALHYAARGVETFKPTSHRMFDKGKSAYPVYGNADYHDGVKGQDLLHSGLWSAAERDNGPAYAVCGERGEKVIGGYGHPFWIKEKSAPDSASVQLDSVRCIQLLLRYGASADLCTRAEQPLFRSQALVFQENDAAKKACSVGLPGAEKTALSLACDTMRVDVVRELCQHEDACGQTSWEDRSEGMKWRLGNELTDAAKQSKLRSMAALLDAAAAHVRAARDELAAAKSNHEFEFVHEHARREQDELDEARAAARHGLERLACARGQRQVTDYF
jgi:ankyrin repeat protein